MKIGIRKFSLKKRLSARLSWKRFLIHKFKLKMPNGLGWIRNPKRFIYNKLYNMFTISVDDLLKL